MTQKSWIEIHELTAAIKDGEPIILIGILPRWRFYLRHIPDSYHVWRPMLWEHGSTQLLNASAFNRWARKLGIHDNSQVIVWDDDHEATWLWWAFQHYGKRDVRILEGGLQAWRSGGQKLERGPGRGIDNNMPGSFTAKKAKEFPIITLEGLIECKATSSAQLWDTRDLAEWMGCKRLRGSARLGRIPWSRHLCWRLFRKRRRHNRTLRSNAEIIEIIHQYGLDPSQQQIFYCQSGVRTTTVIYALYRLGWDPQILHNYCGSWREWSHQPQLPIKRDCTKSIEEIQNIFKSIKRILKRTQAANHLQLTSIADNTDQRQTR